jgi:hypothetical protein
MRLTIIYCLFASYGFNQIPEYRQKQLDSIVTNLDRVTLNNLDSVHSKLHYAGADDEERVFLFYGLIAIQYKYDYKRKGDENAKEYSVYYIAQKKKAVCRDFALIFDELCKRSEIPCVIAYGRAEVTLLGSVIDIFKPKIKRVNHAWNIVKFNEQWRPVDPTWSKIDSIKKYYTYDDAGRRKYAGKVKISNREYYDMPPRDFYRRRKSVHPAYYCMDTIYTYKTSVKKYSRRKIYSTAYDFNTVLDSLSMSENYEIKKEFQSALKSYSSLNYMHAYLARDFKFPEMKYSKYDQLTLEKCDEHLAVLERKLKIVQDEFGYDFQYKFDEHKIEVLKLKKRIQRKEPAISNK